MRKSLTAIRREELVQATISVIAEGGLAGATLASIAKRAEMSPALVNHYFDGKDELLALALRRVSSLLRDEIQRLLPANPSPEQRLRAIIDGNFQPKLYESDAQEAWLQFGLIFQEKGSQHLHRINRILGARFRSNIGYAFRQAVPADQIDDAVDGLVALIDGFSWRFLMNPAHIEFDLARRVCWDFAEHRLRGRSSI